MAGLIVRRENGTVLFDTRYIVHGLVKSGYLQADETWPRKYLRGINLDPNDGSSYDDSFRAGDQMFSITVNNCVSPICFIVGKGCLQGTTRSGNTMKFLYSGGDTNTKAYVFDLMQDVLPGSTFLKIRKEDGTIAFNSLQVPLNVAYAIQAPGPGPIDAYGRYPQPHAGAAWSLIRAQSASVDPVAHSVVNIALTPGVEYAAFLNYSRACNGWLSGSLTGVNSQLIGLSEGAYGRVGGISFMFGPAGATTDISISSNQFTVPGSVASLPVDRYPTALVVPTGNLPFPFG